MKNFVITLVLGAAIGFGCAKALDQSATASQAVEVDTKVIPGGRIGVTYYDLSEDADLDAFENYLSTDLLPKWNQIFAEIDAKFFPIRGVLGEHEGKLGFVAVFGDNDRHAELFPDGPSDELLQKMEELDIGFLPEFDGFQGSLCHTDGVILPID